MHCVMSYYQKFAMPVDVQDMHVQQAGCFYQPREIKQMKIPCEAWIIADTDPSRLLWSSDPTYTNQKRAPILQSIGQYILILTLHLNTCNTPATSLGANSKRQKTMTWRKTGQLYLIMDTQLRDQESDQLSIIQAFNARSGTH